MACIYHIADSTTNSTSHYTFIRNLCDPWISSWIFHREIEERRMKIVIPLQFFLACILIFGVAIFLSCAQQQKETFVGSVSDINFQGCPSGTKSYESSGEVRCCEGDLVNQRCGGRTVCSLSNHSKAIPSCSSLLRKEIDEKSVRFCPRSIPNYFENRSAGQSGCTNGRRTPDGKGIAQTNGPVKTCKIYSSRADNESKADSCYIIKKSNDSACPQGKQPTIVSLKAGHPTVLQCGLITRSGFPEVCFEDDTYKTYLSSVASNWRETLRPADMLKFCSVAQRYYVEKSLTDAELQKVQLTK